MRCGALYQFTALRGELIGERSSPARTRAKRPAFLNFKFREALDEGFHYTLKDIL